MVNLCPGPKPGWISIFMWSLGFRPAAMMPLSSLVSEVPRHLPGISRVPVFPTTLHLLPHSQTNWGHPAKVPIGSGVRVE